MLIIDILLLLWGFRGLGRSARRYLGTVCRRGHFVRQGFRGGGGPPALPSPEREGLRGRRGSPVLAPSRPLKKKKMTLSAGAET